MGLKFLCLHKYQHVRKSMKRANEGLPSCLPGFKKSVSESTDQINVQSEAIKMPSMQQPHWALKAPFEFAENNSVLKKLFENVGYKEETAALGKHGQGIKEPIQVGMWPEKQGLGFNAADR